MPRVSLRITGRNLAAVMESGYFLLAGERRPAYLFAALTDAGTYWAVTLIPPDLFTVEDMRFRVGEIRKRDAESLREFKLVLTLTPSEVQ